MSFLVNLALVLLFSLGLVISGTFVPAKVLNFLDLFGTRGASLAFVMGSAVVVSFVGYRLVLRRDGPIMGGMFHLPTETDIDGRAIFGIGRGLGGSVRTGIDGARTREAGDAGISFLAMFLGMLAARATGERSDLLRAA